MKMPDLKKKKKNNPSLSEDWPRWFDEHENDVNHKLWSLQSVI